MPKDFEFEGSGFKGAEFEQKGLRERNLDSLLKIFGSDEATETLTELAKVKPKTWKAMGETITLFADFIDEGTFGGLSDIGQDFKDTLSLQVEDALSPLTNQIDQALSEALSPIMPEIQAFTNEVASWFKIAIGSWEAIIKGDWDEVLQDITDIMPDWFKVMKNDFRDRLDEMFNNLRSGSIEGLSNLPALPTGVGTGFDIAAGIVAAWTGFWHDLGWK